LTEATARVSVTRTGTIFTRNRYRLALYIDDIATGLHWHVNRKQANTFPSVIIENASQLLAHFGLMEEVYALVTANHSGLPAEGSKIKLAEDLGRVKAGLVGTVVHVEEPMGDEYSDHDYPVTALFQIKGEDVKIALNLSEFEQVSA
jgi:hypothetical protein